MITVRELELARLRAMTPQEKLRVAEGLWRDAQSLTRAALAYRHPDWTESQVLAETRRVMSHGRA